jgi:26S proteasome regulatory subunit N6
MLNQAEDVAMITSMKSVTNAYMNRSLHDFERALKDYQHELQEDVVVRTHLSELYDTLLEQHLSRLIEPYSVVEINHIANLIHLETDILEHKLSQMILDKKLVGVLDQGNGLLIIYEEHAVDPLYQSSLEIVQNLNTVIESLYHRTARLK